MKTLFSAHQLRAINEGWKTQARWIVKPRSGGEIIAPAGAGMALEEVDSNHIRTVLCPYGAVGDCLCLRDGLNRKLHLEIVNVRVEPLHDISEKDCIAEGCDGGHGSIPGYNYDATPYEHFRDQWESRNGERSWAVNPWVWVVEFKVSKGGAA